MPEAAVNPENTDAPVLDEQLCFALYTASNRIIRAYRPLLEPLGLTYAQYLVMLVLWEQQPRSVGDLGVRLHLDSGTLTPLLKRMENAGFVRRTRDSGDERRVLVSLTDEGERLRDKSREVHAAMLCQTELSKPDMLALRDQLMALADTLR